jgi:hypothetical protein
MRLSVIFMLLMRTTRLRTFLAIEFTNKIGDLRGRV